MTSRVGVFEKTSWSFAHLTPAENVPSILKKGLKIASEKSAFSGDYLQPIGGLYVAADSYSDGPRERVEDVWSDLAAFVCGYSSTSRVAILHLRIAAGTRFALDEDEIDGMSTVPAHALQSRYGRDFGPRAGDVIELAVRESLRSGRRDARALDKWSRELATMLDQKRVEKYLIRLFDVPEIVDISYRGC